MSQIRRIVGVICWHPTTYINVMSTSCRRLIVRSRIPRWEFVRRGKDHLFYLPRGQEERGCHLHRLMEEQHSPCRTRTLIMRLRKMVAVGRQSISRYIYIYTCLSRFNNLLSQPSIVLSTSLKVDIPLGQPKGVIIDGMYNIDDIMQTLLCSS